MFVRKVLTLVVLLAATIRRTSVQNAVWFGFVIDTKTSPAFNGSTFGNAGQYETACWIAPSAGGSQ